MLVVSGVREEGEEVDGPPWPLSRREIDAFAVGGLTAVSVTQRDQRWVAEFTR